MFYSHEVLTSRKYGVATIWLVATLGQTSSLRKVSRKAILEVNVPKACESILMPETPLALRLQSNLLYGVSRVFSQQCGYVLSDAQHAQNNIRTLMRGVRTADLDPEASRARPDQLLLEDDPAFLPDLTLEALDLDLPAFGTPALPNSQVSNILSLLASSSPQAGDIAPGLILPSDTTGSIDDFGLDASETRIGSRGPRPSGLMPRDGEEGLLPESDFTFDAEGNLIEFAPAVHSVASPSVRAAPTHGQTDDRPKVPVEYEDSQLAGSGLQEDLMDVDLPPIGDGYDLPEAETLLLSGSLAPPARRTSSAAALEETSSPETVSVRRRVRAAKIIPWDTKMELGNMDLIDWSTNYLNNMANKNRESYTKKAPIQARKNAQEWTLGGGITAVAGGVNVSKVMTPLDMFAGATLYEMITGLQLSSTGEKRPHESEAEDTTNSERRVRPRLDDEDQIGRGANTELVGEDFRMHSDVEMPREATEGMEDISSVMPWNVTASIWEPSVARPAQRSRPGSQGRFRVVSASPLTGRARPSALDPVVVEAEEGFTTDHSGDEDLALGAVSENKFEKYGPADIDKQTTARHSWPQNILDQESSNFREFVEHAIEEKRRVQSTWSPKQGFDTIDFDELLPLESNSRIVAAHAFLHVLSLVSKGMIIAVQKEAYGPIDLRLVSTNA